MRNFRAEEHWEMRKNRKLESLHAGVREVYILQPWESPDEEEREARAKGARGGMKVDRVLWK